MGYSYFWKFCFFRDFWVRRMQSSTSFPGGNQVDGLPPASSFGQRTFWGKTSLFLNIFVNLTIQLTSKYFSHILETTTYPMVHTICPGEQFLNRKSVTEAFCKMVNFWHHVLIVKNRCASYQIESEPVQNHICTSFFLNLLQFQLPIWSEQRE